MRAAGDANTVTVEFGRNRPAATSSGLTLKSIPPSLGSSPELWLLGDDEPWRARLPIDDGFPFPVRVRRGRLRGHAAKRDRPYALPPRPNPPACRHGHESW